LVVVTEENLIFIRSIQN